MEWPGHGLVNVSVRAGHIVCSNMTEPKKITNNIQPKPGGKVTRALSCRGNMITPPDFIPAEAVGMEFPRQCLACKNCKEC